MKKILTLCLAFLMLLTPVEAFAASASPAIGTVHNVTEGYYYLGAGSSSRVLCIAKSSTTRHASAVIHTRPSSSQYFYIKSMGNGLYTIRNVRSGLYLTAKNAASNSTSTVWQTAYVKGSLAQLWYFNGKAGTSFVIQNAASKKVLTVSGNKNINNVAVTADTYKKASLQRWKLTKVETSSISKAATTSSSASGPTGMNSSYYAILNNIIGAVETGGQVYGKRNYADYTAPYTNSSIEYTVTLGWGAFYGSEAQKLVQNIYKSNPSAFKKIDSQGLIQKALNKDWVSTRWNPSSSEKKVLVKLIDSSVGHKCQDALFTALMKTYVADCQRKYTSNTKAIMMYCEIRHLGGSAVNRIFGRCNGNYSVSNILASLKKDQRDTSNSNQVGDAKFWTRHQKCAQFVNTYVK